MEHTLIMVDSYKRSIIKAISWRLLSSSITVMLCLFFTDSVSIAATIGTIDVIIKLFIYFLHERIWEHISYERTNK